MKKTVNYLLRAMLGVGLCMSMTGCPWFESITPEICGDLEDNDWDNLVDFEDTSECTPGPENCLDGLDNDGDFLIDDNDPDCQAPPVPDEICGDTISNDDDELIDFDDPDCFGQEQPEGFEHNNCEDGLDNDGNGKIDGADVGCGALPDNICVDEVEPWGEFDVIPCFCPPLDPDCTGGDVPDGCSGPECGCGPDGCAREPGGPDQAQFELSGVSPVKIAGAAIAEALRWRAGSSLVESEVGTCPAYDQAIANEGYWSAAIGAGHTEKARSIKKLDLQIRKAENAERRLRARDSLRRAERVRRTKKRLQKQKRSEKQALFGSLCGGGGSRGGTRGSTGSTGSSSGSAAAIDAHEIAEDLWFYEVYCSVVDPCDPDCPDQSGCFGGLAVVSDSAVDCSITDCSYARFVNGSAQVALVTEGEAVNPCGGDTSSCPEPIEIISDEEKIIFSILTAFSRWQTGLPSAPASIQKDVGACFRAALDATPSNQLPSFDICGAINTCQLGVAGLTPISCEVVPKVIE